MKVARASAAQRSLALTRAVLRAILNVRRGEWPGPEELITGWILLLCVKRFGQKFVEALGHLRGGKALKDEPKEVVSARQGQQFTLVAGGKMDFSWRAALPYYILPAAFAVENAAVALRMHRSFWSSPLKRTLRFLFSVYALLPFVECELAHDWSNPSNAQVREGREHDLRFRGSLHAWALVEAWTTFNTIRTVLDPRKQFSAASKVAAAVFLSILNGGLGITVAHELLHKPRALDKAVGKALMANVCYMHWTEEHLVGHHLNVATPEDPATARQGQTFYHFFPRAVIGAFVSSWHLYAQRVKQAGGSPSKVMFAIENFAPPAALVVLLSAATRRRLRDVAPFFLLQAFLGSALLETVNYIEHYGLRRKKLEDGTYEAVNPRHSWNSAHHVSNTILFKLQRHSDHHTFPQRPFQLLRNFEESPQLPTGYLGMLLLATVPPAFFWIMDPLVDAHNANHQDMRALDKQAAEKYKLWSAGVLVSGIAGLHLAGKMGL